MPPAPVARRSFSSVGAERWSTDDRFDRDTQSPVTDQVHKVCEPLTGLLGDWGGDVTVRNTFHAGDTKGTRFNPSTAVKAGTEQSSG